MNVFEDSACITILFAALFTVLAIAYGIEAIRDANENLKRLTELRRELFHLLPKSSGRQNHDGQ